MLNGTDSGMANTQNIKPNDNKYATRASLLEQKEKMCQKFPLICAMKI